MLRKKVTNITLQYLAKPIGFFKRDINRSSFDTSYIALIDISH